MPQMLVSFNFLIAAIAFASAILLSRRGVEFARARRFMLFFGGAALCGGLYHGAESHRELVERLLSTLNGAVPFLTPVRFGEVQTRLWLVTSWCIGLTEFYFMFLFIEPVVEASLAFMLTWLKVALALFFVVTLLSPEYFFVVLFHVVTHSVMIAFALHQYRSRRIPQMLLLAGLVAYNLALGLLQQLMQRGVIPTGPLHFNDWYHLGISSFLVALHLLLSRGRLIESLERIRSASRPG